MLEDSAFTIPSSLWELMNSWFTPTVLFLLLNLMIGTIAFTSSLTNHKQKQSQTDPQPTIAKSPSVLQRIKSINLSTIYRSQEPQQDSSLHHKTNPDSDAYQATQVHYFFQDNTIETTHHSQAHYSFEETHKDNPQEHQTNFDFDQKESNVDHFQPMSEENNEAHRNYPQEIQTHFVFDQKDSGFDNFQQISEEKNEPHYVFEQKDSNFNEFQPISEETDQSIDEVYSQVTGSNFSRTKSDTEPSSGEIPAKLPAKMKKSASFTSAFGHFEEENIVEKRRPATVKEKGNAKVTEADEEVDAKADDFINKFKQQLKLQRLNSIIRYKDMIGRGSGGK